MISSALLDSVHATISVRAALGVALVAHLLHFCIPAIATAANPHDLVREFAEKNGRAPSVEDFVGIIDQVDVTTFDRSMLPKAWDALRNLQKPSILLPELIALVVAQRSVLSGVDCDVTIVDEAMGSGGPSRSVSMKYRFAHIDGLYYLRCDLPGKDPETASTSVLGYDGKIYRQYLKAPGQKLGSGAVLSLTSRDEFFPIREHPLCNLMLLDSVAVFGFPMPAVDLALMADDMKKGMIVFERPEIVDGVPCTVLATDVVKLLLDVGNGCLLRRMETYSFKRVGSTEKQVRVLSSRRSLEQFADFGNGIQLPKSITNEFYEDGLLKSRSTAEVVWNSVNRPVPVSLVRDIIPKGARVSNVEDGLIYREGIPGSVESLLKDAIDRDSVKRSGLSFGWLMGINIGCFLIFAVAVFVSNRRKKSGKDQ